VGAAFHRKIGVPAIHVPYKGTAPAIPDLIAGRIPAMLATLSDSLQQHRGGAVRILAVAGAERSTIVPEAETFREADIDLVVPGWMGLYGPRDLPVQLQAKLQEALQTGLNSPSVSAQLLTQGMFPATTTSVALAALQRKEFEFWGPIVRESGFTPAD
jgi:tripartite-type tricarboxylate transporter receptor subunit TctC